MSHAQENTSRKELGVRIKRNLGLHDSFVVPTREVKDYSQTSPKIGRLGVKTETLSNLSDTFIEAPYESERPTITLVRQRGIRV